MTNSDYILFLDESAETKTNPYLLLGGIIISRNNYKKFLIPSIQNTKSMMGQQEYKQFILNAFKTGNEQQEIQNIKNEVYELNTSMVQRQDLNDIYNGTHYKYCGFMANGAIS